MKSKKRAEIEIGSSRTLKIKIKHLHFQNQESPYANTSESKKSEKCEIKNADDEAEIFSKNNVSIEAQTPETEICMEKHKRLANFQKHSITKLKFQEFCPNC